jgi:hypothetical protein
MSKKVTKEPKTKQRKKNIPNKKSELFFVMFHGHCNKNSIKRSSHKNRGTNNKKTIIIDGPPRIIKKILFTFNCDISQKCGKGLSLVHCDSSLQTSLKEVLHNFQEQHIIKFVTFCPTKCRSNIDHKPRDAIAKVIIGDLKSYEIKIPSENQEIERDMSYLQYKGQSVKIIANSVDGVARTAKLMGVRLYDFHDNCLEEDFSGDGIVF